MHITLKRKIGFWSQSQECHVFKLWISDVSPKQSTTFELKTYFLFSSDPRGREQ